MLSEQVALELRVVHGDAGVREHLPDERCVLDLLRNLPVGEQRLRRVPRCERRRGVFARADRSESRARADLDEAVVPHEIHQRVTPVEEDRVEHGARVCLPWRDDSSGPRSRSLRSR